MVHVGDASADHNNLVPVALGDACLEQNHHNLQDFLEDPVEILGEDSPLQKLHFGLADQAIVAAWCGDEFADWKVMMNFLYKTPVALFHKSEDDFVNGLV